MKQVIGDFEGDELYAPEVLERLAKALAPEDVQLFYQTAIIGRRDLALAPDPRTGFEMTLLRMIAFRPGGEAGQSRTTSAPIGRTASSVGPSAAVAGAAVSAAGSGERRAPSGAIAGGGAGLGTTSGVGGNVAASGYAGVGGSSGVSAASGSADGASGAPGPWGAILSKLDLQGAARQLASHCVLVGRQGAVVRLALDPRNKFVRTASQEDKLAQALSRYFGEAVRLEFETAVPGIETPAQAEQRASLQELDSARRSLEEDPGVQGLRERFGATLLPETVRPVKSRD
jgi:DNA polymerase-3 subunit gamma/tau